MYFNNFSFEEEVAKANSLLYAHENEIPVNVKTVIRFLSEHNIGFVLSRNIKVFSCKDARSNRLRLGHIGIPLYDEMKSIVFKGTREDGIECVIAAHCRGHLAIDKIKISKLCSLTSIPIIMPENELFERFKMEFGTVNPMLLEINSNGYVINVFDESLMEPMAIYPGSMMTNAGDHTWGIEFVPSFIIEAIRNRIIAKIAVPDKELKSWEVSLSINPKSIGIITGNGPDSGIALWNRINNCFVEILAEHFIGDISLPEVHVISMPSMGLSMELDKRDSATWETISRAVKMMKDNKVDLLALACHTTHYYTKNIREIFEHNGKKFISMAEVTIDYIRKANIHNIAILGIGYAANVYQKYSAYAELKNLEIEHVPNEVLKEFHDLGYDVKKMKALHTSFQKLISLIKNKIRSQNVILALTELSILYEQFENTKRTNRVKNIIDPIDIYARKIVLHSLGMEENNCG